MNVKTRKMFMKFLRLPLRFPISNRFRRNYYIIIISLRDDPFKPSISIHECRYLQNNNIILYVKKINK